MYLCTGGCTFSEGQWSFSFDMSNEPVRFWTKSEKSKHIQSVHLLQTTRRGQQVNTYSHIFRERLCSESDMLQEHLFDVGFGYPTWHSPGFGARSGWRPCRCWWSQNNHRRVYRGPLRAAALQPHRQQACSHTEHNNHTIKSLTHSSFLIDGATFYFAQNVANLMHQ